MVFDWCVYVRWNGICKRAGQHSGHVDQTDIRISRNGAAVYRDSPPGTDETGEKEYRHR